MKTLKLDHDLAQAVVAGKKHATWRLNDDKDLHVNDKVVLIDKVTPNDPKSWRQIGIALIETVTEKTLKSIGPADMTDGDKFISTEEVIRVFKGFYGPHVDADMPVKIIQFSFTPIEHNGLPAVAAQRTKYAKLFADGGSRGNPGPSASGYALLDSSDKVIVENGLYLGVTTNNQAEYQALKIGLEEALKQGINNLDVYMDSMLVVNQMKGNFKVKNQDLLAVHNQAKDLSKQFAKISFTHVPRELNKIADSMVNQILDESGVPRSRYAKD